MGFAHEKRLGRLSGSGFDRQIRGRSPRYGLLNLIHYIGLFGNHKGRLKTGFQTTFVILDCSVFAHGKWLGCLSESEFARQTRGQSPRYGWLNLIHCIGCLRITKVI